MNNGTTADTTDIRRLLQDNMRRSGIALLVIYCLSLGGSMILTMSLLNHSARQLSRTLRNELLVGNNSYATKLINQNMQGQFDQVDYQRDNRLLFSLRAADTGPNIFKHTVRMPICLNLEQESCESALVFRYSLARYFLVITVMAGVMLLFSLGSFLLFRKRLLRVIRHTVKAQKEAALGRLSAQICHDLKLPSLIFQKIAQVESWNEFSPLRPQLEEHVRRLFSMIDKLKRLDLEGLIRPEHFTFERAPLESFLHSVVRAEQRLTLTMPDAIALVADRDKLERSLANLILNAGQAGARHIEVELRPQGPDLHIEVINDGPVVPPSIVAWFNDTKGKTPQVPVGLGLSLVRDTIWGHGGSVELHSSGNRTVFTLLLPHAAPTNLTAPAPAAAVVPAPSAPCKDEPGQRQGIWVDPELRTFLEPDLTPQQHQHFFLTSDTSQLQASVLVISGQTEIITAAIEGNIPVFHHRGSGASLDLRRKLQQRLKLLRPLNDSPNPVHAPDSPARHAAD